MNSFQLVLLSCCDSKQLFDLFAKSIYLEKMKIQFIMYTKLSVIYLVENIVKTFDSILVADIFCYLSWLCQQFTCNGACGCDGVLWLNAIMG